MCKYVLVRAKKRSYPVVQSPSLAAYLEILQHRDCTCSPFLLECGLVDTLALRMAMNKHNRSTPPHEFEAPTTL